MLIGNIVSDRKIVVKARMMKNNYSGDRRKKYSIDPLELIKIDDQLDSSNLTMIGIYHSHPNYKSVPSETDVRFAWPNITYLIIGISTEGDIKYNSWIFDSLSKSFTEEKIKISD